jgi:hypothetical protein
MAEAQRGCVRFVERPLLGPELAATHPVGATDVPRTSNSHVREHFIATNLIDNHNLDK